jgi:hypothetical protein
MNSRGSQERDGSRSQLSPQASEWSQVSPVGGRETTGVWAWWGVPTINRAQELA